MENKTHTLLLIAAFLTVFISNAQTFTTNTTPVGMEHNLLFNATSRYTVTQTGSAEVDLEKVFDGQFKPSYTAVAPTEIDPTVITIEGLPNIHTQLGAWIGWTTRYWQSKNFLIEGYDEYSSRGWETIAEHVNDETIGKSFTVKVPRAGYTKLRFTFYSATGTNGRLGISELFFIHPEATTPYAGLGLGAWINNGEELSTTAAQVTTNKLLAKENLVVNTESDHSSIQIGSESNDRIISDNTADKKYGGGMWFRVNKRDDSGYIDTVMLDDLGNVGIGTKTPTQKLDIKGNIALDNYAIISKGGSSIGLGSGGIGNEDGDVAINIANNGEFEVEHEGVNVLSIGPSVIQLDRTNTRNVGIGTTNPDMKLSVYSNTQSIARFHSMDTSKEMTGIRIGKNSSYADLLNTPNGFGISVGTSSGNLSMNTQNEDHLALFVNKTNRNVGIGTTTPQALLHVNNSNNTYGAILATSSESPFTLYTKSLGREVDTETFRLGLKYNDEENNGFISFYRGQSTTGGFLGFSTNGEERIRVSRSGNVGIGTTDPKNTLSVNGSIWAKKVRIELVDAADWVFEEDYSLRSLTEVERFIKTNKHLPEIPSAEEFRTHDMEVSEMTNKLLQKIEELTLYTIDQEKQLLAQKEKIENLEAAQSQNNEVLARLAKLESLLNIK